MNNQYLAKSWEDKEGLLTSKFPTCYTQKFQEKKWGKDFFHILDQKPYA